MADIELVIKVPECFYEYCKAQTNTTEIQLAVKNGVPLPKGHGRLGDLSKVYDKLNDAQIEGTEEYIGLGAAKQIICDAKTIIEAESEEEE